MTSDHSNSALGEAIRFCVVGLVAASTYFAFSLLLEIRLRMSLTAAATFSFAIVSPAAYFLNYSWTFRSNRPHVNALPRFFVASTGGVLINSSVVALCIRNGVARHSVALLVGAAFVVAVNYTLSKFWVFVDAVATRDKC